MRSLRFVLSLLVLALAVPALAAEPAPAPAAEVRCNHGVKKTVCTRCNPRLAPVFKAKGDWCPEHDRPESQCVLCNPGLAKQGVK